MIRLRRPPERRPFRTDLPTSLPAVLRSARAPRTQRPTEVGKRSDRSWPAFRSRTVPPNRVPLRGSGPRCGLVIGRRRPNRRGWSAAEALVGTSFSGARGSTRRHGRARSRRVFPSVDEPCSLLPDQVLGPRARPARGRGFGPAARNSRHGHGSPVGDPSRSHRNPIARPSTDGFRLDGRGPEDRPRLRPGATVSRAKRSVSAPDPLFRSDAPSAWAGGDAPSGSATDGMLAAVALRPGTRIGRSGRTLLLSGEVRSPGPNVDARPGSGRPPGSRARFRFEEVAGQRPARRFRHDPTRFLVSLSSRQSTASRPAGRCRDGT